MVENQNKDLIEFNNLVELVSKYREVITDLVKALSLIELSSSKSQELIAWFYDDGWAINWGDDENGLYSGGDVIKKAKRLEKKLLEQGVDITDSLNTLQKDLKEIWVVLPDFYSRHGMEGRIKTPVNYNFDEPFPESLLAK